MQKNSRVLIVALNAAYYQTSLACRCLKASLFHSGIVPSFFEFSVNQNKDFILREIISSGADVFLFSVYIWNVEYVRGICTSLKKIKPECTVILGGPEASFSFERFFSFADFIVCGEGEGVIEPLVQAVLSKAVLTSPYVAYKGSPYAEYHTVDDLDTLPFSYEGEDLTSISDKLVYYESSRGCIYNCAYCLSCVTKGTRAKSEERVFSELKRLHDAGVSLVKFCDRTFNFDKGRAMRLMERIARELSPMKAHFEMCADFFDEEWFSFLSKMPKDTFQFEIGIQSINPEALKEIRRNPDVIRTIEACRRVKKIGNIEVHADLIAALPHDTYDDILKAVDLLYDACDVLFLGRLKMLYGSPIRDMADRFSAEYEDVPPYAVLKTSTLSYDELMCLMDISEVIDTYKNSKVFEMSLEYALNGESPSVFFEGLCKFLKGKDALSRPQTQEAWYGYLYEFAKETVKDADELSERLRFDFFKKNGRELKFFERDYDRGFKSKVREYLIKNKEILAHDIGYGGEDVREIIKRIKFTKVCMSKKESVFMRMPDTLDMIDVTNEF